MLGAMSSNRIAVVTGASKGIGRATAQLFAREGFRVFALARSAGDLESLKAELPERINPIVCDVLDVAAIRAACQTMLETAPPTVLVNNAGVALGAPLGKTSLEDFERIMDVNARAPFLFCQQLVPAMVKAGSGRVINVASIAGLRGEKYTSAYCASKHALVGLTRALAQELAGKNVTVNAVCPGWTDTEMVTRSADAIAKATGRSHEQARETLAQMNPMGKLIDARDVAQLCLFLASDAAKTVTGSCYVMDGGEVG